MTLLPTEYLERHRDRARLGNLALLENAIEFVDEFYDELKHGDKAQAYKEEAGANFVSEYTMSDRINKVVRFQGCNLRQWFTNGIGWDHLEQAPLLRPENPAGLIDDCINRGNENGETMTVREMTNFSLGEENRPKATGEYHFNRWFGKFGKLPLLLKWSDEKTADFNEWLNEGKERFFK